MEPLSGRLIGAAALLLATTAWGGMFPVAKSAVRVLDPVTVTLLRYSAVALILSVLLIMREGTRAFELKGEGARLFGFGAAGMVGFNVLALYGLRTAAAPLAAMIMVTLPFLVALIRWLFKRLVPPPATLICAGISLAGVGMVVSRGQWNWSILATAGRGELLVLLGALFWAIYTVGREYYPDWSTLKFGALSCGLGTLGLFGLWLCLIAFGSIRIPSLSAVASVSTELIYLASVAGVVAILAWAEGIRRLGATHGALFMSMVPITAFTIEMARGFRPHWPELAGTGLAIAALILNNWFAAHGTIPTHNAMVSSTALKVSLTKNQMN